MSKELTVKKAFFGILVVIGFGFLTSILVDILFHIELPRELQTMIFILGGIAFMITGWIYESNI